MPGPRLIHLVSVAKSFPRPGEPPLVVLRPGTISLPADRRLAILAGRRGGKTTLLQLLGRSLEPDQGEVVTAEALSPIVNAGALLHPQLTGLENIRFIARAYGFETDLLLSAIDALCGIDFPMDQPLKNQDGAKRRNLEAAITIVLPFGCYLFDEVGQLDADLLDDCMTAATDRQAGLIFTTSHPRFALRYAEAVVIIQDRTLLLFHDVDEAVQAFELTRQI